MAESKLMNRDDMASTFAKCKRLIRDSLWNELRGEILARPPLCSYTVGDDSLLAYARETGDTFLENAVRCGLDPNTAYSDGTTLLMDYAALGNLEMVRFLINEGADVNRISKKGETAFSYTIARDQLQCAKELFANGASVDFELGPYRYTPEDLAQKYASSEFQDWLSLIRRNRKK